MASWAQRNTDSYKPIDGSNRPQDMAAFEELYHHPLWVKDVAITYSDLEFRILKEEAEEHGLLSPQKGITPDDLSFNITQNTIGSMLKYVSQDFFCEGQPLTWPDSYYTECLAPVTQALFESTNLSTTFENVARSLTNWMRDYSNEEVVGGEGQVYVVRIRVNWGYLALPLATVVAGCGFILFTIFETRRLGLPAWKTDIIPAVLYALDPETRTKLRSATATTEDGSGGVLLREAVKDTFVRLEREDGRPCLKAVKAADKEADGDPDEGFDEIPLYVPDVMPDPSSTDYGGNAASPPPRTDSSLQDDQGNPMVAPGHMNQDDLYRSQGHAYW